jgi:hypothetical protein
MMAIAAPEVTNSSENRLAMQVRATRRLMRGRLRPREGDKCSGAAGQWLV